MPCGFANTKNQFNFCLFKKRKDLRGGEGKSGQSVIRLSLPISKIVFLSKVKPRKGPVTGGVTSEAFLSLG